MQFTKTAASKYHFGLRKSLTETMEENDPIVDILEEDEEDLTISYVPDSPETEDEPVKPPLPNPEMIDLRHQLEEQQREIQRLLSFSAQPAPTYIPQQPASTTVNQREVFKQQLQNAYLADPAEALLSLYEKAKQDAVAEAQRNMVPVAGATTRFAIDQFRRSANLLKDEEEEFEGLIAQISAQDMAQANPDMLGKQLTLLKQAAKGAALEKRQASPQPRVPLYSSGSSSSSGARKPVQVKLTKTQKSYYAQATEDMGLTPAEAIQLIKSEGIS